MYFECHHASNGIPNTLYRPVRAHNILKNVATPKTGHQRRYHKLYRLDWLVQRDELTTGGLRQNTWPTRNILYVGHFHFLAEKTS